MRSEIEVTDKLLLRTKELQDLLSCGKEKAVEIGDAAGARITFGRMVRWERKTVEKYLKGQIAR